MEKEITGAGKTVNYTFRKSRRARRLRISIAPDGLVTLTSPARLPESFAERFLSEKIKWVIQKLDHFKKHPASPLARLGRADYLEKKNEALKLVLQKLPIFSAHYHFAYRAVVIRNQKTRWGSCSRRGNLSFNYKIIYLPEPLQNYLIVHELCHLAEMNHGKKFWSLVARTVPNHKILRRELKKDWRV